MVMKNKNKELYVLIDPGHGTREYTKGKQSPDKRLYEGEWNREFSSLLSSVLSTNGIKNHIVVPEDNDVSLRIRTTRINKFYNENHNKYEIILISIHINAADSDGKYHDANGWTVYCSKNCSEKSKILGKIFGDTATEINLRGNRYIPSEGYHQAAFYIITYTNPPAILCENMFMDNKEDEDFLLSNEGKEKLIYLYFNSIKKYQKVISKK